MHSRIILSGPGACGKDYMKEIYRKRGFGIDKSFTTRPIREKEMDDPVYEHIGKDGFLEMIQNNQFYQFDQFGSDYYGTSYHSFFNNDVFIMTPDGISKIKPEDRKNSLIYYFDVDEKIRLKRLKERHNVDMESPERHNILKSINDRIELDKKVFDGFIDYDIRITNPNF